jgi:hypothetical protein
MTKVARRHFDRTPQLRGFVANLPLPYLAWPTQRSGAFSDQVLVGLAASTTQLMIEMCDEQAPTILFVPRQPRQNFQQHHGVQATRDSHKNTLVRLEEVVLPDVFGNFIDESVHAKMRFIAGPASTSPGSQ